VFPSASQFPLERPAIPIVVRTLGSKHLADALTSLDAQTRQDFEVVVVDMSNGANAKTLAQCPALRSIEILLAGNASYVYIGVRYSPYSTSGEGGFHRKTRQQSRLSS
jgi:hypothetical protein